ncbi:uncharacterized protein [Haliotis cracherodii]|uniref:uncharacterized protein n=1 Tax=Haliotis cracherodii TaxID=6455 RepID=UPI0039EAC4B9
MTAWWAACVLALVSLTTASYKKGAAVSKTNYQCGDTDAFTNIAWWYDWKQTPWYHTKIGHCTNSITRPGRVPMVWGWRKNIDHPLYFHNDTSKYVLGFNEPNHMHQSNLTPAEAATAWKVIEARADKQNQLLVGPAAIRCSSSHCLMDGVQWYREFFQHCKGCRVDYIATHAYWCSADTTLNFLKELWDNFKKPIWLTEFACPSNNVDHVLSYMKEILPRLERADYVARYSWYASRVAGTGAAKSQDSLLELTSARLSTLGKYYNNFM